MFKTKTLVVNMSAGDYTLEADDLLDVTTIHIEGNLVPRVLTFPSIRKLLQVVNYGLGTITLALGSSSVPFPAGYQAAIYIDGSLLASAGGGSGTGAITFLMLSDVPHSYTGKAGQVVAVNSDETGLEFSAAASGNYLPGVGLSLDGITFNISDADLLAFMALSPVANSLPYFTSPTAMSLISTTPFGRGLLDEDDAGTLLATINAQPHAANLDTWAGLLPSAFQPANSNLTLWAAVQPNQFLLGTSIGGTIQAHSVNLDGWAAVDPDILNTFLTSADLTGFLTDADIGVTVQAHSDNLDGWSAEDPAVLDTFLTSADLTGVLRTTDIGVTVQGHAANLDDWSAIAPATKVDVSAIADVLRTGDFGVTVQGWSSNLDAWALLATSTKQDHSANLDAWSALATSAKISTTAIGVTVQPFNANLANWAAKTVPTGDVVGTTDTQTLINKVYTDITTTMFATNVIDTDTGLTANANTRLATQRAVKAYADAISVARTYTAGTGLGLTGNQFNITDQELLAFAGLTLGVDMLPYATSASAMSTTPLTAFARTLLDDASQAAMQTTLGLVIGTNVQAWNTVLDTWGTKTPPAGVVLGTTDAQTVTNKSIDAAVNFFTNIALSMFAAGVIDTDPTLAAASNGKLSTQAAIKAYVDNAVAGLKWKPSARVATTANITLSGTQTIDGVAVIAGDRVLVKAQTTGANNGIYVVAAGAWMRATDADTGPELVAATVTVEDGTLNADTQWTCNNNSITLGSTAIVFIQISGAGTYSAGFGLTLTGNQFALTDQELVAFANLTLAADMLPYATGASTMSTTAFTPFARTLLDDANQAAMQATLGLVPGTNVQAQNANLQALAGLASAIDTMPYFTGSGTASLTSLSAFARTILDDANGAAVLTTIGGYASTGGDIAGNVTQSTGGTYVMGGTTPFVSRSVTNNITPNFQVLSTGAAASMLIGRMSNDANFGRIAFAKTRGSSVGAHGAIALNDGLGEITFAGSDGTKMNEGARITVQADDVAGTNYTPSRVGVFTAGTGGASAPAERLRIDSTGVVGVPGALVAGTTTSLPSSYAGSAITPQFQAHNASTAAVGIYRYGASASPGIMVFSKSRGALGAHGVVNSGDQIGAQNWVVSDGTVFVQAARMAATTTAVPNTGVGCATRLDYVVHNGTAEVVSFGCDQNGNFTMGGGTNIIIAQTRHVRLRAYTVATLPLATVAASEVIWCSDLGGGAGPLVSNGTNWMRFAELNDYNAGNSNADITLQTLASGTHIELLATISADRTITLPSTLQYAGARKRILRQGLGAFLWKVAGGAVPISLGIGDWCEFVYTGTAWRLVARGCTGKKRVAPTANYTVTGQEGTSTDAGVIEMNVASANTVTILADATLSLDIGTTIEIVQFGAGQTSFVASSGVTLLSEASMVKIRAQYCRAFLRKTAANTWILNGDLAV